MTVARMWEARLADERVDAFFAVLAEQAWPELATAPGFAGGEVYRADADAHRVVVVTRWADAVAAALGARVEQRLSAYAAREPHAWEFEQVPL
jgi:heme-degrading monooxygenase HmoA